MKVALCCIGRMENQYAVEFVEWYKCLGFDKIMVYDNNHYDEEHFEDVLGEYVDSGFVDIVDVRDRKVWQLNSYADCYRRYGNDYDWIAFFDFDEFLVLKEDDSIKAFLDRFSGYDVVKINWMTYTDNGLVYNDHRPLNERFTEPMQYDRHIGYGFPENNHVKSIVRGGIDNFVWSGNPHIPSMRLNACNCNGTKCSNSPFEPYDFSVAYIKHFTTKTIEEWMDKKVKIGYPDRSVNIFASREGVMRFFKYNECTDEKLRILNERQS